MRQNRFVPLLILVLAIVCSVPVTGAGVKYKSTGTFVDSSGGQHPWSVNDGHTLIWESSPYIPVGAIFASSYLAPGAGEDAYQADAAALQALKSKGITDIILKSPGPITSSSPAALQKLVSYLDSNGFAYGVEMDDGPSAGLEGYLVSPSSYRQEGPSSSATITSSWPNVDSAIYVVLSRFDNTIKENGGAVIRGSKATINLSAPLRESEILMVYPHKAFRPGQMGDLWSGYDEFRDRLLAHLKGVKFGSGLRFFMEPFASKMDFGGEMACFLPDSDGFRIGFEAYLTRKYKHEGGMNSGWGLNENLDTIEHAARLVPLWAQGRGAPYLYDRASGHLFSVNPAISGVVWQDILDYRDTSAQGFMNSIAETLRKQVANVPVIFRSSAYSRVYANPFASGFDGIGAESYGAGEAPVVRLVGPLYSLAEESGKSTWFIAAPVQASADGKMAYSGESSMAATLDSLREVGCKGFFMDNLTAASPQLDWLGTFKGKIGKPWTDFKPLVIGFPTDPATGAYVKRLAPDTWWLPTLRRGNTTYIGDTLFAYTILAEGKTYIWSGQGKQSVVMNSGGSGVPSVEYPGGMKVAADRKGMFTLSLDENPTVLRGINFTLLFARDTAQKEVEKLSQLIPVADKAGIDVKKARAAVAGAQNVIKNGQSYIAYGIAQEAIALLEKVMGPNLWIEAEKSPVHNFGSVTAAPGASGALALVLDTEQDPPLMPYSATFSFETTTTASYEVWLAGTPAAEGSPASYSVDGVGWTGLAAEAGKAQSYAPGLAWYKITVANLTAGHHTLTIRLDGRRAQDNRYYFAMDAVVLSPRGFTPNGVAKPF